MSMPGKMTKFGHRPWTIQDRNELVMAFKQGTPLNVISHVLNRSLTSVNKALTRYGARLEVYDINDQPPYHDRDLTYENVIKKIKKYERKKNIRHHKNVDCCLNSEPVNSPVKTLRMKVQRKCKTEPQEIHMNLKSFFHVIRKNELNIQPLYNTVFNGLGLYFTINNQPLTIMQVLVNVNKDRLNKALPIYTVHGLTNN